MWVVDCVFTVGSSTACRDVLVGLLRPQSFTTLELLSVVVHSASLCSVTGKDEWVCNSAELFKARGYQTELVDGYVPNHRLMDSLEHIDTVIHAACRQTESLPKGGVLIRQTADETHCSLNPMDGTHMKQGEEDNAGANRRRSEKGQGRTLLGAANPG